MPVAPATPTVVPCGMCGRPAAGVVSGGLQPGEALICSRCLRSVHEDVCAGLLGEPGTDTTVIRPVELA